MKARRNALVNVENNVEESELGKIAGELHRKLPLTGDPRKGAGLGDAVGEGLKGALRVKGVEVLLWRRVMRCAGEGERVGRKNGEKGRNGREVEGGADREWGKGSVRFQALVNKVGRRT
jgi:hypothetical protein